jgi:D-2-hydroxyacid dehydrogenase (NADP+)
LPRADWLLLACPLTPETRNLIDARRLALLPRHAGLINVSRGEVVDEAALTTALAAGALKGAYLDVFTHEPLTPESPLWSLPNVVLSPHNSATSTGNQGRGAEIFLRNLEAYLQGAALENEVTPKPV